MSEKVVLSATGTLCGICVGPLPANGDFVTCYNCNTDYHYLPCASLSEQTYARMTKDRKLDWKCTKGRPKQRSTSASSGGEIQQGQRDGDHEDDISNRSKRFRSDDGVLAQDIPKDLKSDIKEIKNILNAMNTRMNAIEKMDIQKEINNTCSNITNLVEKLMAQVEELNKQNKEKNKK